MHLRRYIHSNALTQICSQHTRRKSFNLKLWIFNQPYLHAIIIKYLHLRRVHLPLIIASTCSIPSQQLLTQSHPFHTAPPSISWATLPSTQVSVLNLSFYLKENQLCCIVNRSSCREYLENVSSIREMSVGSL